MRYVPRALESQLLAATRNFPAVVLTGPRRAGKTFLLQHLFPRASYYLFEDPDIVARFRADPQGFLDDVKAPAILDEIQNVPEVFNYVRSRVDRAPRKRGQWLMTGSQEAGLMRHVTESMAGRAAVLQLLPMSVMETSKAGILRGGFPEVLARPLAASLWFSSYLQTYLERDVRSVSAVHDLAMFRRFLALLATRHGQVLNKTDLAAPLGMSVPGIASWLSILEATHQILIIPPFFENLGKRLIKSPRLYISDSGLVCHLLGIESETELRKSPLLGQIFEGFIASEIVKAQLNAGRRREIYYFRDQQGLEVDFVLPRRGGGLRLVEAKATRTPTPAMAAPMSRLASAWRSSATARGAVEMFLVHQPSPSVVASSALLPSVKAVPWPEFLARARS